MSSGVLILEPEPTSNKPAVAPTDQLVSTQHKARINGETVHYTVTCGTVPRITGNADLFMPRRTASPATHAMSRPQVLACGTGVPVDPDVNT